MLLTLIQEKCQYRVVPVHHTTQTLPQMLNDDAYCRAAVGTMFAIQRPVSEVHAEETSDVSF